MKKITLLKICLLVSYFIYAQPTQEWVSRYNGVGGNHNDWAYSLTVDGSGNVYVTGVSNDSTGGDDYVTVKYNSLGVQQWEARYNGVGNGPDGASSITVDGSGNVYVTGQSYGGSVTGDDYATIKYNSAGVQQWTATYNTPTNAYDQATAIAVDGSGNTYVTGSSYVSATGVDYATIKYNSSGIQQWVSRYSGYLGNNLDGATDLVIDGSGNAYVTGWSTDSGVTRPDYATVKYNSSGVQQWVARYNGTGNLEDTARKIAVDAVGNVYVTGSSWSTTNRFDYVTVKYNSLGAQQWAAIYDGPAHKEDYSRSIAVDGSGNVYVTGTSQANSGNNYGTIKYNSAGVQQWVAIYDGGLSGCIDDANSLALDGLGNVYVTGASENAGTCTNREYGTVKYNSAGIQQWVIKYSGPASGAHANSIALDGLGNVYVTGWSYGGNATWYDYATIKYSQPAGIEENNFSSIALFPNPATSELRIENAELKIKEIEIYSSLGEKIFERHLSSDIGHLSINVADFLPGIYFITLTDQAGNRVTRKVLKM